MIRLFQMALLLVVIYFVSVLYRAHALESNAEKYMEETLVYISKPWNYSKFVEKSQWWTQDEHELLQDNAFQSLENDLGNLLEIKNHPDCNIHQVFLHYKNKLLGKKEFTYATCKISAIFEKNNAGMETNMEIRLISENNNYESGDWKLNKFILVETME